MGRPREHDETTRRGLLEVAGKLLAEEGPDAITNRRLAAEAATTTRAIYSLFGSKSGLLQALAARGYRLLADRVASVTPTEDPAADLVTVGVEAFRSFALARPGLFRFSFERIPAETISDPDVTEAAIASYQALLPWIERAQQAGAIDNRPPERIAFAFHSCCLGLATSELSRQPPPVGSSFWQPVRGIDGATLWRDALNALVTGLSPPSGA